ncbi:UDP-N-acetylglucosamine 2-epimerase (hydrolyzing) [Halorubrum sp. SD690R]|uniref:UDP-N-acetylglucosamine 2-epimerase n=1 Tax=Halorubrum sp. SD690R TaxID=2518117 RepID=UPI0010F8D5D5|nr:UDP-N-acetylglucosamine 2-epimerase [Halorubrum sp. SD690R]TKX47742.1 UDP-N-acetylglucosamine 2-epimerase (hydrolyzing) [Halorubrum sp. SD690R]
MRKICFPVTTRGNYGKFKPVMRAVKAHPELELQLIVAGGALLHKYGNFVEDGYLGEFEVDKKIYFLLEGENPITMAKSTGIALTEFTSAFENLDPDVVMTIADRFEELAIGTAAAFQNIPLAHIEGGEVSGSVDESIRHAITKMSHLHFPSTERAAERVRKLGERPESIFNVGTPSLDVISNLDLDDIETVESDLRDKGVGADIRLSDDYLLVIQHPITTEYDQNRRYIDETIKAIDELNRPTVWLWPNMDAGSDAVSKGIRVYREQNDQDFIRFFTSLPLEQYAVLLNNASCIVGNSSSGIRESAYLGVPSVNIGNRQNGRQRADNVVDVPHDADAIKEAIGSQMSHEPYESSDIYGDGNSGEWIADVIAEFEFNIQKQISY